MALNADALLDATAEVVEQQLVLEVVDVVDVPQDPSIDQVPGVVDSLQAILGQAHLDEPANELAAIEYFAIDSNAPSAEIEINISYDKL